jgi:hypothetical protein
VEPPQRLDVLVMVAVMPLDAYCGEAGLCL